MKPSISIHPLFREFVETELLPDLDIDVESFWSGLASLVHDLTPENRALLSVRDRLQEQLDEYHRTHSAGEWDADGYKAFLAEIGYLEAEQEPFKIKTENVDPEIAQVAGPQLVVPVSNARFALNAANARWGSLYDALYGTDVISEEGGCERGGSYNPQRGSKVIEYAQSFLDRTLPLASGSHRDVVGYRLLDDGAAVAVDLADGGTTHFGKPDQFVGSARDGGRTVLLFRNHGLHVEVLIDPGHPIGKASAAGVADIVLESAVTTIQDCEDSVAAVDAEDKVGVYRNWLGLMRGNLEATFQKGGQSVTRSLLKDREYVSKTGEPVTLPGRSLMLVRNVGHLMTTNAVLDAEGNEVFEGLLDAVVTTACALYDLRGQGDVQNSRSGSVYIVKPKMHGSAEAAFADKLFATVEDLFQLPRYTLKIGVMDEERRTTVNLSACIRQVEQRLVFINTGFLDRTGDEIHTSMVAGAMLPKEAIKKAAWITAYEDWNVDVGIRCGLPGRAQIGKGMWAMPDEMAAMVEAKRGHPLAGANCAWVPSPTAATLHAMHYHEVDVFERQRELASRPAASLDDILTPPFMGDSSLSTDEIQKELDNNAQGILGYVVRWIDQGVGCSKVPDINDVGLMEDRATLRISSQHIANWVAHGICDTERVMETFERMAKVVDGQNAHDGGYVNMAPGYDGIAFQAACELALEGSSQPNGYTEPLLHAHRRRRKQAG